MARCCSPTAAWCERPIETVDLIVVGSGAAGLSAACTAAALGRRVLLLEQASLVGGTSAISGGMVWIPANHHLREAGLTDSLDDARTYLRHVLPPGAADHPVLGRFLQRGDEALRFLETHTALQLQPVRRYPDYEPSQPGATLGGRVLEPVPFDGRVLGEDFALLRPPLPEFLLFGGMMVHRADIPHLRRVGRSWRSTWHVARLLARHARERLHAPRGTTLHLGNALVARLFKSARDLEVDLRLGTPVTRLLAEAGRVCGAEFSQRGVRCGVLSRGGVVLACGGISHDRLLRAAHLPPLAGSLSATVQAGEASSGAELARAFGAMLSRDGQRQALWVPASRFTRADGSAGVYPHTVGERAKPGLIAVDQDGRRFVNEARSYHAFVQAQLAAGPRAVPAWLVCDRRFLWRYGLGCVKPFALSLGPWLASGYLRRAATLEGLAQALGIPAAALQDTVRVTNEDARRGEDSRFGRGSDAYQRHLGDADHTPNPCVAPIEHAPFFAVEVWPADLGMAAGLVTDGDARVLSADGRPIDGLYACGNDMQSVMGGAYPGPGITLGPALVFGHLAGRHAASAMPSSAFNSVTPSH